MKEPSHNTPISDVPDDPVLLTRLAYILYARGKKEEAWALCERAIAFAPNSAEVHALTAPIFSYDVPGYHFVMVRDTDRNRIYEESLRAAVQPESRVLDIGSGTGLFAMLAARAGAATVLTCEANFAVAQTVAEVIAKNGLGEKVRVVCKHSFDLEVGVDLEAPADILLLDNVSSSIIADGILPSTERAVRGLLRPGGIVIPSAGILRVALAEDRDRLRWRMQTVEGLDLTPFNKVAAPCYQLLAGSSDVVLRSEPQDIFRFEFQSGGPFPEGRADLSLASFGGLVSGIAQWVRFDLDGQRRYENTPTPGKTSAFAVMFHPLPRPIDTAPGQPIRVVGSHDRARLHLWAEPASI